MDPGDVYLAKWGGQTDRYSTDAQGHEHSAQDGKFVSKGGAGAKSSPKRSAPEKSVPVLGFRDRRGQILQQQAIVDAAIKKAKKSRSKAAVLEAQQAIKKLQNLRDRFVGDLKTGRLKKPAPDTTERYSLAFLTREPNRPLEFLFHGLPVAIECRKGELREKPGKFARVCNADYGEIVGIPGADGDSLDCYVGPDLDAPLVFLVCQMTPDGQRFDELKAMLGFASKDEARACYLSHYPEDWKGLGSIEEVPAEVFAEWCLQQAESAIESEPPEAEPMDAADLYSLKWNAETYAQPSQGQRSLFDDEPTVGRQQSIDWDEKKHPRDESGQFVEKGSGAAKKSGGATRKVATATPDVAPKAEGKTKRAEAPPVPFLGRVKLLDDAEAPPIASGDAKEPATLGLDFPADDKRPTPRNREAAAEVLRAAYSKHREVFEAIAKDGSLNFKHGEFSGGDVQTHYNARIQNMKIVGERPTPTNASLHKAVARGVSELQGKTRRLIEYARKERLPIPPHVLASHPEPASTYSLSPVSPWDACALKWITIGARETGEGRKGGFPVQIDTESGKIVGGKRAEKLGLHDVRVSDLKEHFDERRAIQSSDEGDVGFDFGAESTASKRKEAAADLPRKGSDIRAKLIDAAGDDERDQASLYSRMKDVVRVRAENAREFNDQLDQFYGSRTSAAKLSLIGKLSKRSDPSKVEGFDQLLDSARRDYPALLRGEFPGDDDEEANLAAALKGGKRRVPTINDADVLDEALHGWEPPSEYVPEAADEWDAVPFSLRASLERYSLKWGTK